MDLTFALTLPRDAPDIPLVRAAWRDVLRRLGVTVQSRDKVERAFARACERVLRTAGPGEAYRVELRVEGRRCVIRVLETVGGPSGDLGEHEGAGVAPEAAPEVAEAAVRHFNAPTVAEVVRTVQLGPLFGPGR